MPCPDGEIDKARLIAAVEAGSAARHEILNRLDLCQMQLSSLSNELKRDGEPHEERIEAIGEELRAIAAALDHFRPVSAMRPEKPRLFVFSALIDEAVADLQRECEELGVEIVLTGENPTLELIQTAARFAFFQLLRNSLDGFQRARRQGKREICIKVSRAAQNRCQILFRDNGPGIETGKLDLPPDASPSAVSARIFEPGVSTSGASGFGLSIAKRLLEGLDGSIVFLSSPKGTQFEIGLPIATGRE